MELDLSQLIDKQTCDINLYDCPIRLESNANHDESNFVHLSSIVVRARSVRLLFLGKYVRMLCYCGN